ncbi:MAG TPA: GNAT family N-acetyltransferase [Phycisphaerae bacterium]|nr:GNAT family N-acetyltransferase [Phycisphaerae bacterium]
MGDLSQVVSAVRRSDQVYYELVSSRHTIDCAYAYTCGDFPDLAECNFVGEVVLADTPDPVALVNAHFAERGLRCHRWEPAAIQPPAPVEALVSPLGFERRETAALGLSREPAPAQCPVRILGGRAMRRAYTAVVAQRSAAGGRLSDQLARHQLERLNEPQYDAFVAISGDDPVGMVSLLQVGEIGRICDLYVLPDRRGRGVAAALLAHVISTARRWSLRTLCARVAVENDAALRVFSRAGLEEHGRIVSFSRPDAEAES